MVQRETDQRDVTVKNYLLRTTYLRQPYSYSLSNRLAQGICRSWLLIVRTVSWRRSKDGR